MKLRPMQVFYGALALAGAGLTWSFNVRFMIEAGGRFDLADFVRGGFANAAASSLTADILVVTAAAVVWMLVEARRLGMRRAWLWPLLTFSVALAFAFPLFLAAREGALQRPASPGA